MKIKKYIAILMVMVLALQGLVIAPVFAESDTTGDGTTVTDSSTDDSGDGSGDGDREGTG